MTESKTSVATDGSRLSVKTKCRIVEGFSMLVAVPGIFVLVLEGVPLWGLAVCFGTFWFSGMLFVIAMIGDGKQGLGIKTQATAQAVATQKGSPEDGS